MTNRRALQAHPRAHSVVTWSLLVLLASCGAAESDGTSGDVQAVVTARTVLVVAQPFTEVLTVTGTVVPRAGAMAQLSAPSPARIARIFVQTGQNVSRGTPLVEFEQAPFLARAHAAEAALQSAVLAAERARRLVSQGIVARKDQEQADAALAAARADALSARRDAQLSRLDAPIAGVVTRMTALIGASVDASQPLVEVVDTRLVDIVLQLSANDAARVSRGAHVELSSGQGAGARSLGASTVTDIGGVVDSATRSVAVRIRASGLSRQLRIGETISADIAVAEDAQAIVVPTESLVPSSEGFIVFVVDSTEIAHERVVIVGGMHGDRTRILTGLTVGERVVTYGAFGMTDGATVKAESNSVEKTASRTGAKPGVKSP